LKNFYLIWLRKQSKHYRIDKGKVYWLYQEKNSNNKYSPHSTSSLLRNDALESEFDFLMKFVVYGEYRIGKTSILERYCDDIFHDSPISSIGVDFKIKTINVFNERCKLQIWDCVRPRAYRILPNSFFRGAKAILFIFDVSRTIAENYLNDHMEQLKTHLNVLNAIPIAIVAAKCDLPELEKKMFNFRS